MQIQDFSSFGGIHADTASLRNQLDHVGLRDPATGKALTEAMVFGIGGGIGTGYGFCPSVPRDGSGGGVSIGSRHGGYWFDGTYQRNILDRIGISYSIEEASSANAGQKKLIALLEAGDPVLVWCAPKFDYNGPDIGGMCMTSSWSVVVHGVDEASGQAMIADLPGSSMPASLDSLAASRGAVCTHKNRMMVLGQPKKLTATGLKHACLDGLRACVQDQLKPYMKSYSLHGLVTLTKMIANDSNKAGWLKVYPGGKMYWPLRDLFSSVEMHTGGGAMRGMFADFLAAAAVATKKKALLDHAAEYRELAADWTAFAEAALPNRVAPFKKTKTLLRKRESLWREKGSKGRKACLTASDQLVSIEREQLKSLAMPRPAVIGLLNDLRIRVESLHAAETTAIHRLAKTVG